MEGRQRDDERRTMTVEEAGALLGVGRNLAYDAVKRGEIPSIRVGRRILVPRDALDRLLAGDEARVAEAV